jgi:hypothetical protein
LKNAFADRKQRTKWKKMKGKRERGSRVDQRDVWRARRGGEVKES